MSKTCFLYTVLLAVCMVLLHMSDLIGEHIDFEQWEFCIVHEQRIFHFSPLFLNLFLNLAQMFQSKYLRNKSSHEQAAKVLID